MTRKSEQFIKCHECNSNLICPDCKNSQKYGTAFSLWLREQDEISSAKGYTTTDIDFVWRNYNENWLIVLEEKTNAGKPPLYGQQQILDQMNKMLSKNEGYRGYYLLQFENKTPDDSEWIMINGAKSDKTTLLYLLKKGSLPEYDY